MSRTTLRLCSLPSYPTRFYIRRLLTISLEQVWTLIKVRSMNSHSPTLTHKSAGGSNDNPKPDVVVGVIALVPIAIRTTAVPRIVVPRTATQHSELPTPLSNLTR